MYEETKLIYFDHNFFDFKSIKYTNELASLTLNQLAVLFKKKYRERCVQNFRDFVLDLDLCFEMFLTLVLFFETFLGFR